MDLKRLRYFVVVAEELSFTRAAARLRISQPPLSQMIGRMEDEIGFKLFERTKRKVVLTEGGKVFLEDGRNILKHADEAIKRARRTANGETGHLRVAFTPWADFTTEFLEIFRHFGAVAPDVTVDFHSMPSWVAAEALDDRRVDVAFVMESPQSSVGVESVLVLEEELVAAIPKGHELARKATVALHRLAKEPQIVVARDRIVPRHNAIRTLFAQNGLELKARHMIDHPQTTLALVAAGAGVALVPASFGNIKRPGVVYRRVKPTGQVRLIAVWKSANRTAVLETFIRTVGEVLARKKSRRLSPAGTRIAKGR
jgi:DNA-binding transcriptional LysR family regulator